MTKLFKKTQKDKMPIESDNYTNNYIGCMRRNRTPKEFFKLLAKTCEHYNIKLVYFTPRDVNTDKGTVNGKVLIHGKWEPKEVTIPPAIDNSTSCYKHKDVTDYLSKVSYLSNDIICNKSELYKLLEENKLFDYLIPPYITTNKIHQILEFLHSYREIVLKPRKGHKGLGIYKIAFVNSEEFKVSYKDKDKTLNSNQLKELLSELVYKKTYICQKYIHSYDKSKNPFDCRIRLEKNLEGDWEVVINLMRIANNQKVVSNVAQGGYVAEIDGFLKVNYPENWEEIKNRIIYIGENLPCHIEEITNSKFSSLGLDVGLEYDGSPYLYEVNTGPGTEFALGEIALTRAGFYFFMSDQYKQIKE